MVWDVLPGWHQLVETFCVESGIVGCFSKGGRDGMGYFSQGCSNGLRHFVEGGRDDMGCFAQGDRNGMKHSVEDAN